MNDARTHECEVARPLILLEPGWQGARYGAAPLPALRCFESLGARVLDQPTEYDCMTGWDALPRSSRRRKRACC